MSPLPRGNPGRVDCVEVEAIDATQLARGDGHAIEQAQSRHRFSRRYSASIKNEIRRKNERRVEGLKAAFALLAQDDCISRKTFEELVKETNRVENYRR